MTLHAYLQPLIRWWRLIATVTILALGASAVSVLFQPDIYVSRTTLVVGQTFLDPNPNSSQFVIGQQLAAIYADMAMREPIQIATMEALGIDWLPEYNAWVVPNTQMIEISVKDTNPERAQIIARELASQLIKQSPTIGETQTGEQQDFIKQQLDTLRNQIEETERNISQLQQSLAGLTSASQIASLERQIDEQNQKLASLRTTYAGFLASSQEGAVNILSPVEPANLPTRPTGSNKVIIVLLAGMVAASLGAGAAYLLEFLDRTVKTTSDVERIFKLPVIGYISQIEGDENGGRYMIKNPYSILAENFRMLQSNISFFKIGTPIKSLLITSPGPGDGKTTIASNLAQAFSQAEENVLLIDADLRRPSIHKVFGLREQEGVSDVLVNKTDIESVITPWSEGAGLGVITAGTKTQGITDAINSKRFSTILSTLKVKYDLVIIDAPPLIIADSYRLASRADGVILVLEPGKTTQDQAKAIKEQLQRANARVIGIVFNKINPETAYSLGDYQYRALYSPEYYGDYIEGASTIPRSTTATRKILDFFEHGKIPTGMTTDVKQAIKTVASRPRKSLRRKRSRQNRKSVYSTSKDVGTRVP